MLGRRLRSSIGSVIVSTLRRTCSSWVQVPLPTLRLTHRGSLRPCVIRGRSTTWSLSGSIVPSCDRGLEVFRDTDNGLELSLRVHVRGLDYLVAISKVGGHVLQLLEPHPLKAKRWTILRHDTLSADTSESSSNSSVSTSSCMTFSSRTSAEPDFGVVSREPLMRPHSVLDASGSGLGTRMRDLCYCCLNCSSAVLRSGEQILVLWPR